MKYNNTNILPKAIALLFTLQFGTLKPLEMPACLMQFNTGNGTHYIQNCKKIDEYVQKNKDQMFNSLAKQFAAIEAKLFESEQKALLAIKAKYQISNEIWQKYLADLHRMKTIYTKSMQKSHPDAIHDPNIPADILEILITLLEKNNINPYSINLKLASDEDNNDNNSNVIAQASNCVTSFESLTEPTLSYSYKPSTIELFPVFIEEKLITHKISTCAHEIQHIIQHHSLTYTLLVWYLHRYYNIESTDVEKTEEYHTLAQIHEAQAEILSAIKDPKIAECLKTRRETVYYPNHLYEEHFYHLAYIDMLWKIHGEVADSFSIA
jgi:hypothetical protein